MNKDILIMCAIIVSGLLGAYGIFTLNKHKELERQDSNAIRWVVKDNTELSKKLAACEAKLAVHTTPSPSAVPQHDHQH